MALSPTPDFLIEARERARIITWLMLFRAKARREVLSAEIAGHAEAIIGIIIERIAMGEHSDIDVDLIDARALH